MYRYGGYIYNWDGTDIIEDPDCYDEDCYDEDCYDEDCYDEDSDDDLLARADEADAYNENLCAACRHSDQPLCDKCTCEEDVDE